MKTDTELAKFYNDHLAEKGFAPGAREIARFAGFTSPSTGHTLLVKLEALGLISGRRHARRAGR